MISISWVIIKIPTILIYFSIWPWHFEGHDLGIIYCQQGALLSKEMVKIAQLIIWNLKPPGVENIVIFAIHYAVYVDPRILARICPPTGVNGTN